METKTNKKNLYGQVLRRGPKRFIRKSFSHKIGGMKDTSVKFNSAGDGTCQAAARRRRKVKLN